MTEVKINTELVYDFGNGPERFLVTHIDKTNEVFPYLIERIDDEGLPNPSLGEEWISSELAIEGEYYPINLDSEPGNKPTDRAPEDYYPVGTRFFVKYRFSDVTQEIEMEVRHTDSSELPHLCSPVEPRHNIPSIWFSLGLKSIIPDHCTFSRLA